MPYTPEGVGYRARETSAQAAEEIGPSAATIRARVLAHLLTAPQPLTADEIADALGLPWISVRPRCTELSKERRIRDSGVRKTGRFGRQQIAWTPVPKET